MGEIAIGEAPAPSAAAVTPPSPFSALPCVSGVAGAVGTACPPPNPANCERSSGSSDPRTSTPRRACRRGHGPHRPCALAAASVGSGPSWQGSGTSERRGRLAEPLT
eukprot:1105333-Rhodomonas_salina.1